MFLIFVFLRCPVGIPEVSFKYWVGRFEEVPSLKKTPGSLPGWLVFLGFLFLPGSPSLSCPFASCCVPSSFFAQLLLSLVSCFTVSFWHFPIVWFFSVVSLRLPSWFSYRFPFGYLLGLSLATRLTCSLANFRLSTYQLVSQFLSSMAACCTSFLVHSVSLFPFIVFLWVDTSRQIVAWFYSCFPLLRPAAFSLFHSFAFLRPYT